MTQLAYTTGNPANLTGGANASMADIKGPLDDIKAYLNGSNLDDARLTSPNNAIWRTLAESPLNIPASQGAGTYWFNTAAQVSLSGTSNGIPAPVQLDSAGYAVAGKTAKLRLRVSFYTGGAPGVTPVFGIYAVASNSGPTGVVINLGAVVAGSTATFATPGANAYFSGDSSTFDFPTLGGYMFGVSIPGGGTAAGSVMSGRMQLQISHV